MNKLIFTEAYSAPEVCEKEILRYAGCKLADNVTQKLLNDCLNEVEDKLSYKVCFCKLAAHVNNDICDFTAFKVQSANLSKNLDGCKEVVIFGATVGVGIDRLISKYSHISPAKALMLQAIGAERIEALCDTFCEDIKTRFNTCLKPRFSAGYGDLPLDTQKQIFNLLNCSKHIGLALNDSLIMSPSKSVTAFVGLCDQEEIPTKNKCLLCGKKDCAFRGAL